MKSHPEKKFNFETVSRIEKNTEGWHVVFEAERLLPRLYGPNCSVNNSTSDLSTSSRQPVLF